MQEWWYVIPAGIAVLFILLGGAKLFPNTKINWETLASLMRNEEEVDKYQITGPDAMGADFAAQFRTVRDSVKYFRSVRGGKLIESLDVYRRGEGGFVVTFYDGSPKVFQRPPRKPVNNPSFAPAQETALTGLLERFRRYAKAWPQS